jgi:hypothetical protein
MKALFLSFPASDYAASKDLYLILLTPICGEMRKRHE